MSNDEFITKKDFDEHINKLEKELQIQIIEGMIITALHHIVNALHVEHHSLMDIVRNADILISIRAGWERNIEKTILKTSSLNHIYCQSLFLFNHLF